MNTHTALFHDRRAAGRALAETLHAYRSQRPVVFGVARGGVPVAYEVATALDAPLGVLVVRKIGAPQQPEYGIGAVAPGITVQRPDAMKATGVSGAEFEQAAEQARAVMRDRHRRYNGNDDLPMLRGHTVIVVDDGLATGVSARAALRSVRALDPSQLVFAVPVGATESVAALNAIADTITCLHERDVFDAVGQWYQHFEPTSDEDVIELLEEANRTVTEEDLREPG
jgi:predicted phosphoribosyltransferase